MTRSCSTTLFREKPLTATVSGEGESAINPAVSRSDVTFNRLQVIFSIALAVRLLVLIIGHTYRFKTEDNNFGFGWETGRIAASIASGHGFGNPFHGLTGPSAWVAPLYPYLLAIIFKILGIYSRHAAFVVLAINSLISALTIFPIYHVTRRIFSNNIALVSAWTWALLPYIWYWAVRWPWETSLSALLLSVVLLLALKLIEEPSPSRWICYGLVWGVLALTNPSLCSLLPFYSAYIVWRLRKNKLRVVGDALLSALMFVAVISPWTVRNYRVFHHLFFIRSNFGVELSLGNSAGANGMWMFYKHPTVDPREFSEYVKLGEYEYARQKQALAFQYIGEDPIRFVRLSFLRALYYWWDTPQAARYPGEEYARHVLYFASSIFAWWGLVRMLRQKRSGGFFLATALLVYPFVYYLTFSHPRYRHPIEPLLVMLAVFLILETRRRQTA